MPHTFTLFFIQKYRGIRTNRWTGKCSQLQQGQDFPLFSLQHLPVQSSFPLSHTHISFSRSNGGYLDTQADRSADVPLQNPLRSLMWVRLAGITGYYFISLILRAKGKASREREVLLNTLPPALRASEHPLVMDCLAGSLRVQSPTACPCLVTPGWSLPNGAALGVVRTSSQNSSFQSFTVNPEVQGQNIWALGLH